MFLLTFFHMLHVSFNLPKQFQQPRSKIDSSNYGFWQLNTKENWVRVGCGVGYVNRMTSPDNRTVEDFYQQNTVFMKIL